MIGQNWDWLQKVRGHVFVMRVKRSSEPGKDKPDFVGFTEAGIVGCKMGVNAAGIGLCVNGLVTQRDGANGFRKPFHVRCREILDAWTFDKALLPVVQTDRCCSTNFLIGHADGEIIDIEATPDYCSYIYPQNGLVTHANHLVCETRIASEFERIAPHSLYRANRLERLLRQSSGKIGIDTIHTLLSDHFSAPASICRHPDTTLPEPKRVISVAAAAIDLNTRTLYVTDGPPCQSDFQAVPLYAHRGDNKPCSRLVRGPTARSAPSCSRSISTPRRCGSRAIRPTGSGRALYRKAPLALRSACRRFWNCCAIIGLKATFFVPGWTAEKYQDRIEAMLRDNHEVGHHGYLHEWIDPDFPEREREALEKGLEALKKTVGVRPSGYRSPAGETSENMVGLLAEYKFLYDSSLQDDINPYQLRLAGGVPGPIELPWHWSLDDAPYMLFSLKNPRPIMTNSHVLEIWQEEFKEIYRCGGLFNLVCHPQVIGRPSRIAMLREFINFTMRFPQGLVRHGTRSGGGLDQVR